MPTDAEFAALLDNCTTEWITTNGVSGRLVTGKGAYADKSIFLPAPASSASVSRSGKFGRKRFGRNKLRPFRARTLLREGRNLLRPPVPVG